MMKLKNIITILFSIIIIYFTFPSINSDKWGLVFGFILFIIKLIPMIIIYIIGFILLNDFIGFLLNELKERKRETIEEIEINRNNKYDLLVSFPKLKYLTKLYIYYKNNSSQINYTIRGFFSGPLIIIYLSFICGVIYIWFFF